MNHIELPDRRRGRRNTPVEMDNSTYPTNLIGTESLANTKLLVFAYRLILLLLWSWVINGNLVAFIAVWKLNTDRPKTLYYSLLFSDLFIGFFMLPLNILDYNIPDLFLNRSLCFCILGFKNIGLLAYIINLVVANIKSYIQLMWPFRFQNSPGRLERILAAISWGVPTAFICIPFGIILTVHRDNQLNVCSWDFVPKWYKQLLIYMLLVPSVVSLLLVCALTMRMAIRKSKEIDDIERSVRERSENRHLVSRLRTIRVLVLMVFVLVLTWIPFTVGIAFTTQNLGARDPTWYLLFSACLGITALFPLIYFNSQPDIRKKALEVIRSIPILGKRLW